MNSRQILKSFNEGQQDFSNKNLEGVDFSYKKIQGVNFTNSNLSGANFTGANLENAIFTNAKIQGAKFIEANLTNSKLAYVIAGVQRKKAVITSIVLTLVLILSGFPFALATWWITYLLLPKTLAEAPIPLFIVLFSFSVFISIIVFEWHDSVAEKFGWIVGIAFSIVAATGFATVIFDVPQAALSVAIPILGSTIGLAASVAGGSILCAIHTLLNSKIKNFAWLVALILNAYLVGESGYTVVTSEATESSIRILAADYTSIAVLTTALGGVISTLISWLICKRTLIESQNRVDSVKELYRYDFTLKLSNVFSNLVSTSFRGANLTDANFFKALLINVDFRSVKEKKKDSSTRLVETNLTRTNFKDVAGLIFIRAGDTYLTSPLVRDLVINKAGINKKISGTDLRGLNLEEGDFSGADFTDSNLSSATLRKADLSNSVLVRTLLDETDLSYANLNEACIEDLGTTTRSIIHGIKANIVYMKAPKRLKQPTDKKGFQDSEELVSLIKKRLDIIELYHSDGLNFRAVQYAVLETKKNNPGMVQGITGYKQLDDNKWVVSLRISPDADESNIIEAYHRENQRASQLPPEYQDIYLCLSNKEIGKVASLLSPKNNWSECRVHLKFWGNFSNGFTCQMYINDNTNQWPSYASGRLSGNPIMISDYEDLSRVHRSISGLKFSPRGKFLSDKDFISRVPSTSEFRSQALRFETAFNSWLQQDSFSSIRSIITEQLKPEDAFLMCIDSDECESLRLLPWHTWNLLSQYQAAEVTFSKSVSVRRSIPSYRDFPRVLSILGDSRGIDVRKDQEHLQKHLRECDLFFLVEPSRADFSEALEHPQGWDIICFSGHNSKDSDSFSINPSESIGFHEIENSLKKAVEKGLQLVVINSCESLNLAQKMELLFIPQIISMREPIPDFIAQKFLHDFLLNFSKGLLIGQAIANARNSLKDYEERYPIASWMPVLSQNFAERSISWQDLPRSV